MKWRDIQPFGNKQSKLEKRVDELETVLFAVVEKLGYAVTIDSATNSDWVYPELKKVEKDKDE